jgi:hypothetical protein
MFARKGIFFSPWISSWDTDVTLIFIRIFGSILIFSDGGFTQLPFGLAPACYHGVHKSDALAGQVMAQPQDPAYLVYR